MPFLKGYPNYLGIHIRTDKETNIENMNFFEYITYFNNCLTKKCKIDIQDKRMINIYTLFMPCINFDVCKNDKNILKQSGYDQTILHINKFELLF